MPPTSDKDKKSKSNFDQNASRNTRDAHYWLLAEQSRDIIITHTIDRHITYVNPAWVEVTGYTFEESIGERNNKFLALENQQEALERNLRRRAGHTESYTYEFSLLSKAGEKIPVEVRSFPLQIEDGKIQEILLIARDIRERRKIQAALLDSENHFRTLFESAPIPIWEEDFSEVKAYIDALKEKGIDDFQAYFRQNPQAVDDCVQRVKIVNVNQATVELYNFKGTDQFIKNGLSPLLGEETKLVFAEGLLALIEGKTEFQAETMVKKMGAESINQNVQWKLSPHCQDNWERVIVSTQDISELKKSQRQLKISEASYRELFNTIEDAIFVQDTEGRFVDLNQGAEKLYDMPKEEIIGKTPAFLAAPVGNDLKDVDRKIQAALSGIPQEFEFIGKRNDGTLFPKEVRLYPGNYFGKSVVVAVAREITARKKAEAQLKQQLNDLNVLQATAFTCSQATDEDRLIRQITNIIGNTLYPDIYGVLLYNPEKKTLTPHPSHSAIKTGVSIKNLGELPIAEGITGKSLRTGKTILLTDVHTTPDYIPLSPTTQSELCTPIKVADTTIGVINLESVKKSFFSKADERLLNTIAGQMAIAIDKLRLLKSEQRRRQIAETLRKTAAVLTTTLNSTKATELILEELASVLSFESASVQLLSGDYFEIIGGRGVFVLEEQKDRRFPFPGENPNTVVIETRKPLILPNASKAYPLFLEMPAIKSWMGVPLIAHETPIGLLTFDSAEYDHFRAEDAELATSFAHHAATSIKNAQLFENEQKRRKEAETLRETSLAITASLNLDQAIQHILEQLARVLPYDSASVQILEEDTLTIIGGRGWDNPKDVIGMRFPIKGDNPNATVVLEKRVLILDDAQRQHAPFRLPPHNHINSWIGVPLIFRDKVIGMLAIDSTEKRSFTHESAEIAQAFAYQAAIAIENARLFNAERKRREEAEILRQAAITINSDISLDTVLQNVAKQMITALGVTGCAISAWDKEKDTLKILVDYNEIGTSHTDHPGKTYALSDYPLTRKVIRDGEIVTLHRDAPDIDLAEEKLMREQDFTLLLMLPMVAGNQTIGLIELYEENEGQHLAYKEDEINLVKGLAAHAALAVENARLYTTEQTRRQEAETLRQAAHTISSSLNLDEVLNTILASIKRVIQYDSAAVLLIENDRVKIMSGNNLPHQEDHIGESFSRGDPILNEIVETGHPLIFPDVQKNPHFNQWAETNYVRGWMGVPLIVRGNVIGYITLDSRTQNAYTQKHAELAQTFAHQAASAIENARLYQQALDTSERRSILHRLSQDILRYIQSPEETYQAIYKATEKLMVCETFIISLRHKNNEDDEAVYLMDNGKRYSSKKISRDTSIVSLAEKARGSVIKRDLSTGKLLTSTQRFSSKKRIRSLLVSPMYVGKKLIGAISAQSYTPNSYTDEEKILLEMLASHAAAAIENARLFQETERRGKEFAELYQLTRDLVAPQELASLLDAMLKRAVHLIGVSSGDIYLYNSENETLEIRSSYGLPANYRSKIEGVALKKGVGMAGRIAETLEPIRVDDYQTWEGRADIFEEIPFTSVLEVPMIYAGNLIGVLALYEIHPQTHLFNKDDERITTLFATQLAGVVQNAQHFEEISHRLEELEAVNRISISLRGTETPEEMLPVLLDEIDKSLGINVASIWLSDANNEVYKATARGWIEVVPPTRQKNNEGIIGQIYTEGDYYISQNVKTDPLVKTSDPDSIPEGWTGAWLPIRSTHSITGVIEIMTKGPRALSNTDIQLLSTLAEITGNAMHRARLHRRTQTQVKRLTALRDIDTAISSNSEIQVTLRMLIEHTVTQLQVDAANILIITQPEKTLKHLIGNGFRTTNFSETNLRHGKGLPSKAVSERTLQQISKPALVKDNVRRTWFADEGFEYYCCVPLIAGGQTLGVLEIFHRAPLTPQAEWLDFLQTLAGQAAIAIENNRLVEDLKISNAELALAYDTTLEGWGKALELRDKETQGHTLSVTDLTISLARAMNIPENDLIHVYRGALLHDIGKMGIPDHILRKPGPLTKEEWKIMRQHPQFAYEMISSIEYLLPAADIPYCHHERWDGAGYPRGLKGEEIPLAARIFSVVDVWDALLSDRPYRKAWDRDVILRYIQNESGTRFDPKVVETFLKMVPEE